MAERTMEELLRAPTEGYGEAIVLPEINADHFEIKTNLLQLVQANRFMWASWLEFSQEVLGFSNNSSGGNPTSSSEPILSSTTPSFTPFEGGDFILEEMETFLQTPDEFTDLDDDFYDTEGDILYLEQLAMVSSCICSRKVVYRVANEDDELILNTCDSLFVKENTFVFSKDCIDAFETLKKNLTEAPILVVPDWNLPFELMCDASNFAIGAVLGQRKMKHFSYTIC
ncbi:reverse transcriptase domain-containing protein [Tanacetum coccineum]